MLLINSLAFIEPLLADRPRRRPLPPPAAPTTSHHHQPPHPRSMASDHPGQNPPPPAVTYNRYSRQPPTRNRCRLPAYSPEPPRQQPRPGAPPLPPPPSAPFAPSLPPSCSSLFCWRFPTSGGRRCGRPPPLSPLRRAAPPAPLRQPPPLSLPPALPLPSTASPVLAPPAPFLRTPGGGRYQQAPAPAPPGRGVLLTSLPSLWGWAPLAGGRRSLAGRAGGGGAWR